MFSWLFNVVPICPPPPPAVATIQQARPVDLPSQALPGKGLTIDWYPSFSQIAKLSLITDDRLVFNEFTITDGKLEVAPLGWLYCDLPDDLAMRRVVAIEIIRDQPRWVRSQQVRKILLHFGD